MTHHFDNEWLDDLVDEWHEKYGDIISLEHFIRNATGWSAFQYELWVITGRNPDA